MARESHDREDLLRDATAYVSRIQLNAQVDDGNTEVFAGFHSTGAFSLYFNQDPVYHFNRSGELRRAFVDDELIKAEAGSLVTMRRQREDSEVALVRQVLSKAEQADFCTAALGSLNRLRQCLEEQRFAVEGMVAREPDEDVLTRFVAHLNQHREIKIANSPRVTD